MLLNIIHQNSHIKPNVAEENYSRCMVAVLVHVQHSVASCHNAQSRAGPRQVTYGPTARHLHLDFGSPTRHIRTGDGSTFHMIVFPRNKYQNHT